jgi:hypothetical protein
MKTQAYTIAIAIALLSTIVASLSVGNSIVYSTSDDDDDENQPCYKSGFEAGRSGSYNQTQENVCGNTGYSHAYYEGFISGCISSGGGDYFACDSKTDS